VVLLPLEHPQVDQVILNILKEKKTEEVRTRSLAPRPNLKEDQGRTFWQSTKLGMSGELLHLFDILLIKMRSSNIFGSHGHSIRRIRRQH